MVIDRECLHHPQRFRRRFRCPLHHPGFRIHRAHRALHRCLPSHRGMDPPRRIAGLRGRPAHGHHLQRGPGIHPRADASRGRPMRLVRLSDDFARDVALRGRSARAGRLRGAHSASNTPIPDPRSTSGSAFCSTGWWREPVTSSRPRRKCWDCDAACSSSPATTRRSRRLTTAHRDLAAQARAELVRHATAAMTPRRLAARVEVSPWHLCRVFRAATGTSLHAFRLDLGSGWRSRGWRIPAADLSRMAHELGFSSHSHFSAAMRGRLGHSPSGSGSMLSSGAHARLRA